MTKRTAIGLAALMVLAAQAHGQEQRLGITVPAPPSSYRYSALAVDGSGQLYVCDGDALYRLEQTSQAFTEIFSGLENATGTTVDPAALAVTWDGSIAYVTTGLSGCVLEVNLTTSSARELSGARALVSNFGMAVDPIYDMPFVTDSYTQELDRLETSGDGSLTYLDDFNDTAAFGGAIAFAPDGRLIVPVPTGYSNWPVDDNFPVDMYRFGRAWLDDLADGTIETDAGELYATDIMVSGTWAAAGDRRGNAYLQAIDALYKVDPQGNATPLVGDPGQNAFDMVGYGFMGLVYDATQDRLLYAYRASPEENYVLYQYLFPDEIIPGDVDRDGDVDATDLAALGMNWAPSGADKIWQEGNFDYDGDVDATDLAALGMNWNPSGYLGGAAGAPEPAGLGLLGVGLGVALARRRLGRPT